MSLYVLFSYPSLIWRRVLLKRGVLLSSSVAPVNPKDSGDFRGLVARGAAARRSRAHGRPHGGRRLGLACTSAATVVDGILSAPYYATHLGGETVVWGNSIVLGTS